MGINRVFFTCSVTVEYCLCDDDRNTQYYCFICLFDDLLGPKSLCVEMYQYWLLVRYGRMHDIGSWIQVSVLLALLASLFFLSFNKIIVCQRLVDQSIIPNIRSWYSNACIYLSCSKILYVWVFWYIFYVLLKSCFLHWHWGYIFLYCAENEIKLRLRAKPGHFTLMESKASVI